MRYLVFLAPFLLVGGCAQQAAEFNKNPIRITCKGDVQTSVIGSAGPAAGLNVSVQGKCSDAGAYFEIGPPPAP